MRLTIPASLFILAAGCSIDPSATLPEDGAAGDGAAPDVSPGDATPGDAAPRDTGGDPEDARPDDATATDSAMADSGSPPSDAAPPDTGTADTGTGDSGPPTCTTAGAADNIAVALPAPPGLIVDGDLSDWTWAEWRTLTSSAWGTRSGVTPTGDADVSARSAVLWTSTALYVAVEVTDDTHFNDRTGWPIWEADCVQWAFDMARNGGTFYDDTDDFEYGWARTTAGVERFRWHAPATAAAPAGDAAIIRSGSMTRYEVRFTASDLGVAEFRAGDRYGYSWLVDESDGPGDSDGYLEWTSGIALGKTPDLFGELALRDCD